MAHTSKFVSKASEAALAATAFANTSARRIVDSISAAAKNSNVTTPSRSSAKSRKRDGSGNNESEEIDPSLGAPFGFLDNMCGPILSNLRQNTASGVGGGSGEEDDMTEAPPSRGARGRSSRRPHGSFDYDDETYVTDVTSYDEEDGDTYDGHEDRKKRGGGGRRGRDRKPRGRSPNSEVQTSEDGDDAPDDTDTEFSSVYPKKEKEVPNNNTKRDGGGNKHSHRDRKGAKTTSEDTDTINTGLDSSKLLSQPLASGFAKRCYFTKAGIGRTTQHYEGLTLTGNTVLMLASAMKLKGCPTICDEDLRRVEQTYPNQFSRLPDELLLSSGWRRISKYCHFSHKPLPDGVPFFHSRRRCHPNGGFYFLLCSAVGMTRLMDVEPLNRDALAVLQTDFPVPCEKAPHNLIEDPDEWTLVNKFCFFSGGPINVEEDVYYRAELGGTEIYMLAFLSPSLSPEELYRLKPSKGGKPEDNAPLKSVAAVEEIESVYDLTERDFDDLKLYHLGPCRALPPYLLHPEAWTKVLPPHFVAARDEAMRKAIEFEKRFPQAPQPSPAMSRGPQDNSMIMGSNSEYVELGGAGRHTPAARGSLTPSIGPGSMGPGSMGPAFTPHYPGQAMMHPPQMPMNQDPNSFYPPQPLGGASSYHPHQALNYGGMSVDGNEMNYYYGSASSHQPIQSAVPRGTSPFIPQQRVPPSPNPYGGNTSLNQSGYSDHQYDITPPRNNVGDSHWRGMQDEGAFGMNPVIANDQPDDEAFATRGAGAMYNTPNGVGMPDGEIQSGEYDYNGDEYEVGLKTPEEGLSTDRNHMAPRMTPERQRPDLSTKIGNQNHFTDDGTWETRTEGESTYESSVNTGSSYTDTTNPNERNSRRALILQMAKARMKNAKPGSVNDKTKDSVDGDATVAKSQPDTSSLADQAQQLELD